MTNPHPSVVQAYAVKHNIKQKEAREKLKANYEKESKKVDFRVLTLRAIDGMRSISPKVTGLENRDVDNQMRLKKMESLIDDISKNYRILSLDLHGLEEVVSKQSKLVERLLKICEEQEKTLTKTKVPKKTLMEKIRCLMSKLKK